MTASHTHLQFVPFSSALDAGFWHTLSEKKLNEWKLDDAAVPIWGSYYNGDAPGLPCQLSIEYTAFDSADLVQARRFPASGMLHNMNTIDSFKISDKKTLLDNMGKQIWDSIVTGDALSNPSLLSKFIMITFADMKRYNYYYWFAFPALCSDDAIQIVQGPAGLEECMNQSQIASLEQTYNDRFSEDHTGFFLMLVNNDRVKVNDDGVKLGRLSDFDTLFTAEGADKLFLCFCDPSTMSAHPGWPLRNVLALAAYHWGDRWREMNVLCYRERFKEGRRDTSHSRVMRLILSKSQNTTGINDPLLHFEDVKAADVPKIVGWEKNTKHKLGPRTVNLSASMDPARLAASSVDLNLKLMRWRLLPELDLEKVSQLKCLLLGAGTLGCNIARCLMGWGVRNLTLVDNGRISYSNPVRQSLFVFDDCLHGGKPKAKAAAQSMKQIFPGVNATGIEMSIPMPGHAVSEASVTQVQRDVETLDKLVQEHDVIFLLLDTREARWLPTVLGATHNKLVINAALGFDTFLVVRHGLKANVTMETESSSLCEPIHGSQLGCYFCNDVVAPGDSTTDRTLDQQCTVSRPGMSMMAGALAVELMVSVLQHPLGGHAHADTSAKDEHLTKDYTSALGLVPHQIRGFLSRFHNILPASKAFDKCTACSDTVVSGYRSGGFNFLLKAFNDSRYLEDLTGLTQLHAETMETEVWDFSDDESI